MFPELPINAQCREPIVNSSRYIFACVKRNNSFEKFI